MKPKQQFVLSFRRIGGHDSMEAARKACAADNGKLLDLANVEDSLDALGSSLTKFRLEGLSDPTCWEDGDGNKVQTDVSVRTSTTLVFDTIDFPSVLIAEISTLPLSSICEQDMPEAGEVARLMILKQGQVNDPCFFTL